MRKALIISFVFGVLVLAAVVFAFNNKADAPISSDRSSTSSSNQGEMPAKTVDSGLGAKTAAEGRYVEYSQDTFANIDGQKVLFFHAPWCAQCNSIESGIIEQGVPKGLTIIKVDYDSHQELRKKYGVTLQTTFVKIDGQGKEIGKYVAYDEPTFDSVKRNFL